MGVDGAWGAVCVLIASCHTCSLRPDSYRIDAMPKIKVRDRTRTRRMRKRKPLTACRPVSGEGKRSGKRRGKDEARANRGLRRRLRLFQSFKVWRSNTHNVQLTRLCGGVVANPNSHQPRRPFAVSHHSSTVVRSPSIPAGAMWERVVREESGMPNGCPGRVLGPELLHLGRDPGTYFFNLTPGSWPNVAKMRLTTCALRYATEALKIQSTTC